MFTQKWKTYRYDHTPCSTCNAEHAVMFIHCQRVKKNGGKELGFTSTLLEFLM